MLAQNNWGLFKIFKYMNYQNASLFHSKHSVDLFCITRPFSTTSVHLLRFHFEGSNCTHKAPGACPFFSAEAHTYRAERSRVIDCFLCLLRILLGLFMCWWESEAGPELSLQNPNPLSASQWKKMTCSLATEEPLCHSEHWRGTWTWEIWRSRSFR